MFATQRSYFGFICFLLWAMLSNGCRSTAVGRSEAYEVVCDTELAELIQPLLPQVEAEMGEVNMSYLSAEEAQSRILAGSVDLWLSLEKASGVRYLLRPYREPVIHSYPKSYAWELPAHPAFDQTLLIYEVAHEVKFSDRSFAAVQAFLAAGLEAQLEKYEINFPEWQRVNAEQLELMEAVVLDEVNFIRAEITEVLSEIWEKGNENEQGIRLPEIRYELDWETSPITLKLRNVTLLDSLDVVTEITGVYYAFVGEEILIYQSGEARFDSESYVIPAEKVADFLSRREKITHYLRYPQYESCWGEPVLKPEWSEVEKLNFFASRNGCGGFVITQFDSVTGLISVIGDAKEQARFETFLRIIYFDPPSSGLMERL
ncbi:hypothetical protein P3T73_16595 [Kiritimatiellota bacterium B12222]|nr:hypothetical protein P3T73_16595 [Kiritimatiellota bacterium B12222]